jgi:hypothetical protein
MSFSELSVNKRDTSTALIAWRVFHQNGAVHPAVFIATSTDDYGFYR